MRLIDADTLKPSYAVAYSTTDNRWHMYVNIEDINSAPTIDAVDLVRCKACKKVDVVRCKNCDSSYLADGYLMCSFWEIDGMDAVVSNDDYCSYGERK